MLSSARPRTRFAILFLLLPAILGDTSVVAEETPVQKKRSEGDFWSIAGVLERDGEERTMYGVDFRRTVEMECPPFAAYYGGQLLRGDGQSIVRASATVVLFGSGLGQYVDIWFRPIVGIEYRDTDPNSGFGALTSLGGELIFKPRPTMRIALTYDRIFSTLATNTQFGLAFRWGRTYVVQIPDEGTETVEDP